jgi:hypothetical protein
MMGFTGNGVDEGMEDPSTEGESDALAVGDAVIGNVTLNVGGAVGALDSSPGTGGGGLGGAGKTLILDFLKR